MPVPVDAVWAALADPSGYEYWVVGSKVIRDAEPDFPAPGTKFHHTIGFGPLTLSDETEVLEAAPPTFLKLRAKGRPIGTASVTMRMIPRDGGTLVEMIERPDGPYAVLNVNPLLHVMTKIRNAESLMRLEELALRR
ncbi:MAG TPA: SRPBCC family protein [Solirubrobacter sp.]|nr:SRPBCC family protein [Solirubrobacter sp.]